MPAPKEIRGKINSVKKTQKITDAMQKVAASKMRKAQLRMETSMPYSHKVLEVMQNISRSHHDYIHPYFAARNEIKHVGIILVATDRGLCGGLNVNLFRLALATAQRWQNKNVHVDWCLFGEKAVSFFKYLKASVLAQTTRLGDAPKVSDLIGGIKIMIDAYSSGTIDNLFIAHNKFVSTISQVPIVEQLLPIACSVPRTHHLWDYIYEPDPIPLLNTLAVRYIETQVYQAVVDNLACEQVARMVAMKNATDNAESLLTELQLAYNKARQAAITQEIAEIIGGANAI